MKTRFKHLFVCASIFLINTVSAESFPNKPIKMIIPYPPGGITDIVGRSVAEEMARDLGKPVVVENRAGAGGSIGASSASRAEADGYTLFLGTSATHGTNPSTYANLSYDAEADFDPVTLLASAPLMVIVSPSLPIKTLQELIDYAKEHPGELSYATTGTGGSVHLTTEQFAMQSGIEITHIPYKGSAPALVDIVGGHVHVMFDNVPSAAPFAASGKVRALAVTSNIRSVLAPDVPTIDEAAIPGFDSGSWIALYTPNGTPAKAVEVLNKAANKALTQESLLKTFNNAGLSPRGGSPKELAEHQQAEIEKWANVVEAIGYEPK